LSEERLFFCQGENKMVHAADVWEDVKSIRKNAPLVHNITNYVVMNTTANALLALGASPVMAHAMDEVEEMVNIASALVINIGTLSRPWTDSMMKAAGAAKNRGIPMVLDPVGAGATRFRTDTALRLIAEAPPAIIRGNASEIRALDNSGHSTKGVDSMDASDAALESARSLSEKYGCTVSISGAVDIIIQGNREVRVFNGHPMMTKVTGLGCTATALTGAFAAVNRSAIAAASHAMAVMGIAGEIAAEKSKGPGSLQLNFIDALYCLNEPDLKEHLEKNENPR
jgi:hydroxyethylthiazole kinase